MRIKISEKKTIYVLVVGIFLSITSFVQGWYTDKGKWEKSFSSTIREYQIIFNNKIDSNKRLLEGIVYYFRGSEHVTRDEFRVFATPILNNNLYIQALSWVPFVEHVERKGYELEARLFDEISSFSFKEFHKDSMRDSSDKNFYFPVYYVEPLRGNKRSFGLDLYSDPIRKEALEKAWRNGYSQATSKVNLIQDSGDDIGFLIFSPVYKGDIGSVMSNPSTDILGFVVGVYKVSDMLNKTLLPLLKTGLGISVYDGDSTTKENLIYSAGDEDAVITHKNKVLVEGRIWTIVWTASSDFEGGFSLRPATLTFLVLLSFTLFISFIVNIISTRAIEVEKLVKERTDELTNAQRAIEEHKIQRIEEAKFVALGEMAGSIAHEINNPLAIIYSKSRQILKRLDDGKYTQDDVIKSVKKIADTSTRISKIVSGLSHISGDAAKESVQRISLIEVCEKSLNLSREKFKNNGIELIERYPLEDIFVEGKSIQLGQVLLNLMNNAFDALEGAQELKVIVALSKEKGHAVLRVRDTGAGVDEDHLNRLFDPFFTTKPLGKGTGLGLSISQRIIKEHGGEIRCSTGNGTEFTIKLPVV